AAPDPLDTDDPRQLAAHVDLLALDGKADLLGVLEDRPPGVAYRAPPVGQRPAGVRAGDLPFMRPDRLHPLQREGFEGAVEALVGATHRVHAHALSLAKNVSGLGSGSRKEAPMGLEIVVGRSCGIARLLRTLTEDGFACKVMMID